MGPSENAAGVNSNHVGFGCNEELGDGPKVLQIRVGRAFR